MFNKLNSVGLDDKIYSTSSLIYKIHYDTDREKLEKKIKDIDMKDT